MKEELLTHKYHPRIMELRLAIIKMQLERQYGEAQAMEMLQKFSEMFTCNWTLLIAVFNKDNKIINNSTSSPKRKKQEIIFMGNLYGETRYHIAKHYMGMSVNYLYQSKGMHNPDSFVDDEWIKELDDEILVCGVRSHFNEAKRFLISFDNLLGVFK